MLNNKYYQRINVWITNFYNFIDEHHIYYSTSQNRKNNRIDDENNKQKLFGLLNAPNLFNLSKISNSLQLINNNKKK